MKLNPTGAGLLAVGLSVNGALKVLRLGDNLLGDEGATAIASGSVAV